MIDENKTDCLSVYLVTGCSSICSIWYYFIYCDNTRYLRKLVFIDAIVFIDASFSEDYSEGRRVAVMISKYNKHA